MTASEAIKILKKDSCYECAQGTDSPLNCEYGECRVAKATRVAIKALEEVQQYRAIGTLEECRAAVERNNEKTRIIDGITECCGYDFGIDAFQRELSKFCPVCGRKIERSDEE
ncbi:hypothetical protein LIP84_13300 [Roseburia faecis]|jgi:hypothetical protein|uniref:hypothetical protein n=1 Tax=Roseburia faecis TaxID=301302 RepID=UPI001D01813C|nr:hypothetical protein [Roseburia faecis]MCB5479185.1 hypothetical protein [Roseburia faecis]